MASSWDQSAQSMYNQLNDPSGLVWVAHSGTDSVPNAVYVGKETNGQEVYVARAMMSGYLNVGKFVPGSGVGFPWDYGTLPATFQVLTNPNDVQIKWALVEGTNIHPNAVKGGYTSNTIQYIGRTKFEGNHVVGNLYPNYIMPNDCHLFFSHSGANYYTSVIQSSAQNEILLAKPKPACQCEMHCRLLLNCSQSYPKKKKN